MRRATLSRAFTLVELLVVIAIIAVLIAILLPVLNKAKEAANNVNCMANEKQIMIAYTMYTQDHRGALGMPPLIWENYTPNGSLMYYMSALGLYRYDVGPLWSYLSPGVNKVLVSGKTPPRVLEQIMNCPSDTRPGRIVFLGGVAAYDRNFTYSWNSDLRGTVGRINQIKGPTHKILLVEELAPNDGYAVMQGDPDDEPTWRHTGRGNYGFTDGHIETLDPYDLGYQKKSGALNQHAQVIDSRRNRYYFALNVDQ
jgi:prepilin-type N-terminal cleavage/methylation domain-containing protein/prepilin-type processing-associated H-X9-DG protein